LSRNPRLVRPVVLAAVAVTAASLGLPAVSAGAAPSRGHSLKDDLVARADGRASFVGQGRGHGVFFGTAPGHAASRPSDISASASPASAARAWLAHYSSLFSTSGGLDAVRTTHMPGGSAIVRLQQKVGGLPVVAGDVAVALTADNNLVSVSGATLPVPAPDTHPQISADRAATLARRAVARRTSPTTLRATAPVLSVLDPSLIGGAPAAVGPRTVWATTVTSVARTVRHQVFIDAQRGVVALDVDANSHAARIVCDAKDVRLTDTAAACPGAKVTPVDLSTTSDTDALNADRFAHAVDDFYSTLLHRDSLNGSGMRLAATIHYCEPVANPSDPGDPPCPNYPNAFWNGKQMYYGDGYASALDVVGHEMTHGVTQFTSNLFSWYQSGAINESMSDVMGELIQQIEGPALSAYAGQPWLVGEDLQPGGIRSMADPTQDTASGTAEYPADPDRMTSVYFNAYKPWDQNFDNGGVHANDGVGNKAAYLIAAGEPGGSFNGVSGITGVSGADQVEKDVKVANIYYRLDNLMSSGASYADVYNLLPQACSQVKALGNTLTMPDGVSTTGVTAADCAQVSLAVKATEMNRQPRYAAAKVTAASPTCTNGGTATKKRLDNFESSNPIARTGTYKRGHAAATAEGQSFGDWWWSKTTQNDVGGPYQPQGSRYSLWGDDDDPFVATQVSGTPYDRQDAWVQTRSAVSARVGTFVRFDQEWELDYGPPDWTQPVSANNPVYYGDGGRVEYSIDGGSHWYDAGAPSKVDKRALLVNGGYNARITNTDGWFGARYVDPNPLKGRRAYVGSSHGWTSARLDLSSLNRRAVLLRWRLAGDDEFGSYGWYVDNVMSYNCNPTHVAIAAPHRVARGKPATVRGHLVRTGTTIALANLPVTLWERRHGTTAWTRVGTRTTNKFGNVHWSRTHTTAEDYRVRMPGKRPFAPSNYSSATVRLT